MKRLLLIAAISAALASCTSTLYNWGGNSSGVSAYEKTAYTYYDKQSPESVCRLVCMYEDLVTNPGGTRQVPPPGICAEYGYLLLMPETAETFDAHATERQRSLMGGSNFASSFRERGKAMLEREIALYPESAQFIVPLLKRL